MAKKSKFKLQKLEDLLSWGRKLEILILLLIIPLNNSTAAGKTELSEFYHLEKNFNQREESEVKKESFFFLKKYPKSDKVPDVRLILAEVESDPDISIQRFRAVVKYYKYFNKRDYALYRLCQILDLKSRWMELKEESNRGVGLFPSSKYCNEFRIMKIHSLIILEDYQEAESECASLTEKTHDFNILSRAIYLLAEINRKKTGNSRSYIYNLRELAIGFQNSELYPSIIYRLGDFYEAKNDINRAYSAYLDINNKFPGSPEAAMAVNQIKKLKAKKPKILKYIPDRAMVKKFDSIDIYPDVTPKTYTKNIYYSVSIGPMHSQNRSLEIQRLVKNYENVRKISIPAGYIIYIGKFPDTDSSMDTKIRLAAELGINGSIVRFSENDQRSYIYKDQ